SIFILLSWAAVSTGRLEAGAQDPSETKARQKTEASKPAAKKAAAGPSATKLTAEQEAGLARIKDLGGKLEFGASGQLIGIDFRKKEISGDQLEPLKQFPELTSLVLWGPGVANATLAPVAALKALTELELDQCTSVTDAGLEHIAGLVNLRSINLRQAS